MIFQRYSRMFVVHLVFALVFLPACSSPAAESGDRDVNSGVTAEFKTQAATDTPVPLTDTPVSPPPSPTVIAKPAPSARIYHVMLYDSESSQVILLGGQSYHRWGMDLNDVWAYDVATNQWKQLGDSPKDIYCAAYDSESDKVIGFTWRKGETWSFDLNIDTWMLMERTGPTPSGRVGCRMDYDAESDRIVLYGGFEGQDVSNPLNDTWAYDFNQNTWELKRPATSPSPRSFHGMVYDAKADRVIMWGGRPLTEFEDTSVWAYDYNADTWEELRSEGGGPEVRLTYHTMVFNPEEDHILVYGGIVGRGERLNDQTWFYDYPSNSWKTVELSPLFESRLLHAMTYVADQGAFLILGGEFGSLYSDQVTNEIWILEPVTNQATLIYPES